MDTERAESRNTTVPTGGGPFVWWGFGLWMLAGPVLGAAVAWVATVAQSHLHFAPLVIFPLLVGVSLGAMLVGLMRISQLGNRPTILLATVLAAGVTVAAQHYIPYWTHRQQVEEDARARRDARQTLPEEARGLIPEVSVSFVAFMRREATLGRALWPGYRVRGWAVWLTWVVDGLLVFAAAMAMVVPAMRLPYCNRCQSWYQVIRSGRIDVETARQLAQLAELPTVDEATVARYRLLSCHGGCGPTDFELSWQRPGGGTSCGQVWLDARCRNRIMEVLDEDGTQGAVGRRADDR